MIRIITGFTLILILVSCGYDCPEHDKYLAELKLMGPGARDSLEKAYIMKACPGIEGKKLITRLHNSNQRNRIRVEDILICAQIRAERKRQKYMDDYDAKVSKADLDELDIKPTLKDNVNSNTKNIKELKRLYDTNEKYLTEKVNRLTKENIELKKSIIRKDSIIEKLEEDSWN